MLEVNGLIHSIVGGFRFPDGTIQSTAATGGGFGNTLDQAYDQGGPGAGRTITADSGAINIAGPDGLSVSGKVGINTTSPNFEMEVDGAIQADRYYTEDIVFQKDGEKIWRMFGDENALFLENMITGNKYRIVLLKSWNSYSVDNNLEQKIKDLETENQKLNERITALETLIT
jgi:hypothetical protein